MSDIADNLKSVLPGGIEIPDSLVEGEPAAVAGSTVGRWMKDVIDDLGLPGDARGRWTSSDHPAVALTGDIEWE